MIDEDFTKSYGYDIEVFSSKCHSFTQVNEMLAVELPYYRATYGVRTCSFTGFTGEIYEKFRVLFFSFFMQDVEAWNRWIKPLFKEIASDHNSASKGAENFESSFQLQPKAFAVMLHMGKKVEAMLH